MRCFHFCPRPRQSAPREHVLGNYFLPVASCENISHHITSKTPLNFLEIDHFTSSGALPAQSWVSRFWLFPRLYRRPATFVGASFPRRRASRHFLPQVLHVHVAAVRQPSHPIARVPPSSSKDTGTVQNTYCPTYLQTPRALTHSLFICILRPNPTTRPPDHPSQTYLLTCRHFPPTTSACSTCY